MKKFAFILAAISVVFASCNNQATAPATAAGDQQGEPHETTINIRYVSQDSVLKYYTYSDAINQANQKLQLELLQYGNQLQSQAQQLQEAFQQKLNSNAFINQTAAESEYKSVQQKLANYDNLFNKRQAAVQEQLVANAQALADSVNNFVIEYNKEHKYDAILYRESVLYINPALDITQEIIDGLNARYVAPAVTETADKKK